MLFQTNQSEFEAFIESLYPSINSKTIESMITSNNLVNIEKSLNRKEAHKIVKYKDLCYLQTKSTKSDISCDFGDYFMFLQEHDRAKLYGEKQSLKAYWSNDKENNEKLAAEVSVPTVVFEEQNTDSKTKTIQATKAYHSLEPLSLNENEVAFSNATQIKDEPSEIFSVCSHSSEQETETESVYPRIRPSKKFAISKTLSPNRFQNCETSELQNNKYSALSNPASCFAHKAEETSFISNPHKKRKKPVKVEWTKEELQALELGMIDCGTSWALIENFYGKKGTKNQKLKDKTQEMMKNKARSEKARRRRQGLELGIFDLATNC